MIYESEDNAMANINGHTIFEVERNGKTEKLVLVPIKEYTTIIKFKQLYTKIVNPFINGCRVTGRFTKCYVLTEELIKL